MTAPRRILPIIAIAAAVAAVALALLAWRRLGHGTTTVEAAPDRTAGWDAAWKALRGCVLGPTPASTDAAEAIAAADLVAPDRTCGHELVAVARAAGDDEPWARVRRALGELADQLGRHQQRRKSMPVLADPKQEPDRLAAVMLDVEAAVAKVRGSGDRPAAPAVLAALTAAPIVVDGQIAASARIWRNDMHVSAGPDGDQYLLKWQDGQPRVMPQATPWVDPVWSPALGWQAYVYSDARGKGKIMVASAAMDHTATIATVTPGYASVLAAVGEGDRRIVVYTDGYRNFVARSTDAGAKWTKTKLPDDANGYFAAAVSPTGDRLDLAWAGTDTRTVSLDPEAHAVGPLPEATVVSPAISWMQCTSGAVWLVLFDADGQFTVRRADASQASGRFKTQPYLTSCSRDRIALQDDENDFACDTTSCTALAPIAVKPLLVAIGADVLRYQTWDDVIALWWNDKPPVFAKLPGGRQIAGVVEDHGSAIVVMTTDTRVEYARLPK